jgi:aminoglycoside 6'-N-acetyltransferase
MWLALPYRFRSFVDADVSMVERWLKSPEVVRWWGDPAEQFALLKEDLDEPLMRQWIVEHCQRPFVCAGIRGACLAAGSPSTPSPRRSGRRPVHWRTGHAWTRARQRFLRLLAGKLIREGAPLIAIDPIADNFRARRAFARAGFVEEAVVQAKQGMVVLMKFADGGSITPRYALGT